MRKILTELPGDPNPEAAQAESDAREAMRRSDRESAILALKHAVSLDPYFTRAWIELGGMYAGTREKALALDAFQKAAKVDPGRVGPYKILANAYAADGRPSDAISAWQKVQILAPDDPDLASNLGGLYIAQKRYPEAAVLYEAAVKADPSDASAQFSLGSVRLRSDKIDQGLEALHKALEIDSGAEMLNNVAYEMAEASANLSDALAYSQRSVKEVEEKSQKLDLKNIQKADLQLPLTICAYWDTLGWIYFKMGDLARAEGYLNSAWQLGQDGLVGDHLGQVYEKEQKLPAALHTYNLALQANPRLEETPSRMRNLAHVSLPKNRMGAGEELSRMRTVKLPRVAKETVSADFDVLIAASGKIEKASFFSGSETLRGATGTLEKARFEEPLPPDSAAHLLRRGILSCFPYTGCSFVFYPLSVAGRGN
jgi:tetratricopeptide (TPR) repeat protein